MTPALASSLCLPRYIVGVGAAVVLAQWVLPALELLSVLKQWVPLATPVLAASLCLPRYDVGFGRSVDFCFWRCFPLQSALRQGVCIGVVDVSVVVLLSLLLLLWLLRGLEQWSFIVGFELSGFWLCR